MRSTNKLLLVVLLVLLFASLVGAVAALLDRRKVEPSKPDAARESADGRDLGMQASTRIESTPPVASSSSLISTQQDVDWSTTIEQDGKLYQRNDALQTVLFLGVDDGGSALPGLAPGEGRRADTIFLMILDSEQQRIRLLAISRDTITDVDVYNERGERLYTVPTHINMQYFYGDSASRSCYLMKRTVQRLLYDIGVDGYLCLNAQGIITIVDDLGGLTVTMPEDYTDIDLRYQAGVTLTLNGAETERLLRYRDLSVHGSNEDRVERQVRLIRALFGKLQQNTGFRRLQELLDAAGKDVCTDLDAETLKKLVSFCLDSDTVCLPGTVVQGDQHDEFHVDEAALKKLLIELFYEPVQ